MIVPHILRNDLGEYISISNLAVDSKNLYAADSAGGLTAWNKPTFDSPKRIPGQTSTYILSLHSDGNYVYSGSDSGDPVVRIYNQDLDLIEVLKGHVGSVFGIVSDAEFLFTGSGDATVKIWKKDGWKNINSIKAQTHFVLCLAIDDKYIYAGGIDNFTNVFIRDTLRRVTSLYGHEATICSLAVDDDNVYSGSGELWWGGPGSPRPPVFETAVRVWDRSDWACKEVLKGHSDNVNALGVDDSFVYSVSDDGTLRVYSKSDWSEVITLNSGVGRITDLVLDESHIYFGCADGNIRYFSKSELST